MFCVRPGVLLTNASLVCWANALIADDLPALDLPAKAISGALPSGSWRHSAQVVMNSACLNRPAVAVCGPSAGWVTFGTMRCSSDCGRAVERPQRRSVQNCRQLGEIGMKFVLLLAVASLAIAAHAQPPAEDAADKPDLAKAQQIVTQVCGACHGADGNSVSPANPSLAGQHAEYL